MDFAKAAKENPGMVLNAAWNTVKDLPQNIVDSFKETGGAIGEGSAVALNAAIAEKLNAIYGSDIAKTQKMLLAIRITTAVTGAAGIAKTGARLTETTAKAAEDAREKTRSKTLEKINETTKKSTYQTSLELQKNNDIVNELNSAEVLGSPYIVTPTSPAIRELRNFGLDRTQRRSFFQGSQVIFEDPATAFETATIFKLSLDTLHAGVYDIISDGSGAVLSFANRSRYSQII